jgi:cysteine synthase A
MAVTDIDAGDGLGLVTCTPTIPLPAPNGCTVWAKLEYLQPSGSTKDRFAALVLRDAMASGRVGEATTVVEASSGSTSIAFAMACARLGIRFVAVLPENVSDERVMIIRRYGGDVRLTPALDGVPGAIAEAQRLAADDGTAFLPHQFSNPLNALAHEQGTGRELLEQVPQRIAAFVAGVGTGGTLAGAGRALRAAYPDVVVAEARPVADEGLACRLRCGIPGIVENMSGLLHALQLAEPVCITETAAVEAARELCRAGLPVGLSSGLNVAAARQLSARLPAGSNVATVLPDRMERYFSADLFADLVMN